MRQSATWKCAGSISGSMATICAKSTRLILLFYGSYNDQPGGGAAGADPVGPAVRKLWAESATFKEFIDKVSGLRTYDDLLRLLGQPN